MTELKLEQYGTEQEQFWAGEFGNEYIARNQGEGLLAANLKFFTGALKHAGEITSCVEFGANVGMNLRALQLLYPAISLRGIEINRVAAGRLAEVIGTSNVFEGSIFDYPAREQADLALIKGVLIHIQPGMLEQVYDKLFRSARKYILVCEYYNPVPVSISYRGHQDRLFKRDFAGEMLDRFPALELADYGFAYRRDPVCPQDDITWFLLRKN